MTADVSTYAPGTQRGPACGRASQDADV